MMIVNHREEELGRSCIHKSWMQCKKYVLSQHFCLVIQYKCLNILKMRFTFTLDAELHEILIVFMLIFMTPWLLT